MKTNQSQTVTTPRRRGRPVGYSPKRAAAAAQAAAQAAQSQEINTASGSSVTQGVLGVGVSDRILMSEMISGSASSVQASDRTRIADFFNSLSERHVQNAFVNYALVLRSRPTLEQKIVAREILEEAIVSV